MTDLRKWSENAFVMLAGLKEAVQWELAPAIMKEIRKLVDEYPTGAAPSEGMKPEPRYTEEQINDWINNGTMPVPRGSQEKLVDALSRCLWLLQAPGVAKSKAMQGYKIEQVIEISRLALKSAALSPARSGEPSAPQASAGPRKNRNKNFDAELTALARKRDEEIDTSDIPEVKDWSGAVVGKFAAPQPVSGMYVSETKPHKVDDARIAEIFNREPVSGDAPQCVICHRTKGLHGAWIDGPPHEFTLGDAPRVEEIARQLSHKFGLHSSRVLTYEGALEFLRPYFPPASTARTRFQEFDDEAHPCNKWWKEHGQFMMSGGGRKEFIWACRGWIAREQLAEGVEVTGDSLHETPGTAPNSIPQAESPAAPSLEECAKAAEPHNPKIPLTCLACGKPLLLENLFVDDGCPCNSPRGVNFKPQPCELCKLDCCVKPGHRIESLFGIAPYFAGAVEQPPQNGAFASGGLQSARVLELFAAHNITDTDILKHRLEDHDRWRSDILSGRLSASAPSQPSAPDDILETMNDIRAIKQVQNYLGVKLRMGYLAPGGWAYERLTSISNRLKTATMTSSPSQGWVRVEDRLPELSGEYIVTFASGMVSGSCHWNAAKKQWGTSEDGTSWNVTYWQPIPAPPSTQDTKAK